MANEGYPINKLLTELKSGTIGVRNANYVHSESGLWIPEPEVRDTRLTDSIEEHTWKHDDDEPTPVNSRAIGVRYEADNTLSTLYWIGSEWKEVL